MSYQVGFNHGVPEVQDAGGTAIAGGMVHSMRFPTSNTTAPGGTFKYISGPATAKISVPAGNGRVYHTHVPVV